MIVSRSSEAARSAQQDRPTYHGLDALRGVAAIAVVLLHVPEAFGLPIDNSGYLAVDVFFAMSGFVIGAAYDQRLQGPLSAASFVRMRFVRFYPLYLVALVVASIRLAWIMVHGSHSETTAGLGLSLFLTIFFLPSPSGLTSTASLYPLNPPIWSLAVELVLNTAYGVLHRWTSTKALAGIAGACGFILIVSAARERIVGGWTWDTMVLGYLRAGYAFPIGLLLFRHRDELGALQRYAGCSPILLTVALWMTAGRYQGVYDLLFVLILSPLIVAMATGPMPLWSLGVSRYLGRTSYPMYVIHLPFFALMAAATRLAGVSVAATATLSIAILLAGCWYLDVVDERLRRRLNVYFVAKAARVVRPVAASRPAALH